MEAAAASYHYGGALIRDFFHRYGEEAPITGRVLRAAVEEGSSDTIHCLLSEQAKRGKELTVDENTTLRALSRAKKLSPGGAVAILKLFSARHGNDTVPKQRLIKRLTESC